MVRPDAAGREGRLEGRGPAWGVQNDLHSRSASHDGSARLVHRTVRVDTAADAARVLADFFSEVHNSPLPDKKADRDVTSMRRSAGC